MRSLDGHRHVEYNHCIAVHPIFTLSSQWNWNF